MNLTQTKTTFESQLAEALAKKESLDIEIKVIKSKIKKLDKLIKQAEEIK